MNLLKYVNLKKFYYYIRMNLAVYSTQGGSRGQFYNCCLTLLHSPRSDESIGHSVKVNVRADNLMRTCV